MGRLEEITRDAVDLLRRCTLESYEARLELQYQVEDYLKILKDHREDEEILECLHSYFMALCEQLNYYDPKDLVEYKREIDFSDISDLLKGKPKDNRFYQLVRIICNTGIVFPRYIPYLKKIKEADIGEGVPKYFNSFVSRRFCLRGVRGADILEDKLMVLSYNSVRSANELEECSSLKAGEYQAVGIVGDGNTRRVYKVVKKPTGQIFALKLDLPDKLMRNSRAKEVFILHSRKEISQREVMALTHLTHENLARMWDFGIFNEESPMFYRGQMELLENVERNYIVEDYVDGTTLDDRVRNCGPLDQREFVLVFAPILRARKYLQEKGYLHRDIKPDNILVSRDLIVVKLTDLQNAVKVDGSGQYLGESYGSVRAMAPELILENMASFESDLYSIGVCMYFAITGEMPFGHGTPIDIERLKHMVEGEHNDQKLRGMIADRISDYSHSFYKKTLLSPQEFSIIPFIERFIPQFLSLDPGARHGDRFTTRAELLTFDAVYSKLIS